MTVWWISDPDRLALERASINAVGEEWFEHADWSLDSKARLRLVFDIVLPRGRFRLAMVYHNTFPASPPSVRPLNEDARLSAHQYGTGGDLCLQIRSDNWSPDITGAEMVRSTHLLLDMETPGPEGERVSAPSAHDVPYGVELRASGARFYLENLSYLNLLVDKNDGADIEIGLDFRSGRTSIAHLLKLVAEDGNHAALGIPTGIRETCWELSGRLFKVDASSTDVSVTKTVKSLARVVGDRFTLNRGDHWACVLRTNDDLFFLFSHFAERDEVLIYRTILSPFDKERSGVDLTRLSEKRVGIVGLGSLGSKIAKSLARAGVGRFELVDGDILHAGNLERHDADWRDVGRHKSDISAHQLGLIHNRVSAHAWRTYIGAQISAEEAGNVNAALDACDLLVDATADPDVFNHLAFITMRSNHTLVWGGVFAGGVGGEIARSRPNRDPSPFDMRQVMTQVYGTTEEEPPITGARDYDGPAANGEPMIASDADVAVFAAHMSALAIDALLEAEPSAFGASAYLIGLRRGWLFDAPFDTRPVEVNAPVRAASSQSARTALDRGFLISLFDTLDDEAQDTSSND